MKLPDFSAWIAKIYSWSKLATNSFISRSTGYILRRRSNPYHFLIKNRIPVSLIVDVGVADGTPDLWQCASNNTHLVLVDPILDKDTLSSSKSLGSGLFYFLPYALSNQDGQIFSLTGQGRKTHLSSTQSPQVRQTVGYTLKSLLRMINISIADYKCCRILKIDVEGFEYNALLGCAELLGDFDFVFVEIGTFSNYGNDFDSLIKLLYDKSFVVSSCQDAPSNSTLLCGTFDLLFSNKSSSYYQLVNSILSS